MSARKRARASRAIVVDASVLSKTIIQEPESDEVTAALASAARAGVPLLVLPLTRYEVGNVLVKLARHGQRADVDVDGLVEHALALVSVHDPAPGAGALAKAHSLSYDDASYLALAAASEARVLWTFDARLGKAAEALKRRVSTAELART